MKKKLLIPLIAAAVLLSPPAALFRSLLVMLPYSASHGRDSVPAQRGYEINIPGGLSTEYTDWYPFVMTFNDSSGFAKYTGDEDVSLTIMYNFPAFSLLHGCSRLFDPSSPYCGGFYGAYITGDQDSEPYGFTGGKADFDAAAEIPRFDLQRLVLEPFGLDRDDEIFETSLLSSESGISYAGYDGWERFDVKMTVNGTAHKYSAFDQSYIQYGIPTYSLSDSLSDGLSGSFAPTEMYGRIYARYFENSNSGVFFYILAGDMEVLENCDRDILSKSTIDGDI